MPPTIRRATPYDLPAMAELLIRDGEQRRSLNPTLWPLAADAKARIESAVGGALGGNGPSPKELWLVAETPGGLVGVAHAMIVPVPPVYGVKEGPPGIFLDDCYTTAEATAGTAEALLVATEEALRAEGAAALIASCPAAGPWRPLYARHGYEPVTLYLANHGFNAHALPPGVSPARPDDVPGIVKLSADHRRMLAHLNARFWQIHPDADKRFDAWMRFSLTMKDRDMFVAGTPGEVRGYVIAQPIGSLLVPAVHDIKSIGVIDDFYDQDFAEVATVANGGAEAAGLLAAAQSAFAHRGYAAALAVCPAAWTAKVSLLERQGFRTAKLWMLKR